MHLKIVQVRDKKFKSFISSTEIQQKIKELAAVLDIDYAEKTPVFIAVLNGAFIFASDLLKEISVDCEISFVKLASYKGTKSTGNVVSVLGLDTNIRGRHVIILEDIVDTGKTLSEFLPTLKDHSPESIAVAALLVKPDALKHDVPVDYRGFEIPNAFVLGYGLDYDGLGRNLKDIYKIEK